MSAITIVPVEGLPEVEAGVSLAELITDAISLLTGDVVVVTSKIVSKAEGRVVSCDRGDATAREALIRSETKRVLRQRGSLLITETHSGFICANAGVDWSNATPNHAVLLPIDADQSAWHVKNAIKRKTDADVAVLISDTFGRVWRNGAVDVAIGSAGIIPLEDLRGQTDPYGNVLTSTQICTVDEIVAAASLAMGKTAQIPVVVVRGINPAHFGAGSVQRDVVRTANEDLFR